MKEKKYPKILTNIPEGKDLFKSKSHQNISKTIATIIQSQGDIIKKQIIGLEGDWGTGKSNIVKILETELGDKYYHFTYDTWTHQEDLTRKSILQELIFFLKQDNIKIIDPKNNIWTQKENELSQKVLSKNTEYFPKIKIYYVLFFLAFMIIKFGNEISKQIIEGRTFGFYDNSLSYLIDNFFLNVGNPLKAEYIFKIFPFLLILAGFWCFIYSFHKELSLNKNKILSEKLSIAQLFGKQFYWVSGEKLESFSNEKINEKEPSNQMFRNFLKDIDNELKSKNKKLIFTIDNTDRLSGSKLTNIWSTINIFFAENNNSILLENIWLIIPYDEKKIILSMEDEVARGLLEKTFAITFKVTPPLLSNWEYFFDECLKTAFDKIEIIDKKEENQLLKRIFESYESNITPRKIINFINQISTHYIQNPNIKLRYNAIFELTKSKLFNGNINENILDRKKYLENLDTIFISDDQVEINISKIIYGINNDKEAEEALLLNSIENILVGNNELSESILKIPAFNVYFNIVFKKFIDKNHNDFSDKKILSNLTNVLIKLEDIYITSNNLQLYRSLWQKYSVLILKSSFNIFDETYQNVIINCEKKTVISLINNGINSIFSDNSSREDIEIAYITFLESLDNYLEINRKYKIQDFHIERYSLMPKALLPYLKQNPKIAKKYKFVAEEEELKNYFKVNNQVVTFEIVKEYKIELFELCKNYELTFLINDINAYWITNDLQSIENVEILMLFYKQLKNRDTININILNRTAYMSLIKLIKKNQDNPDLLLQPYMLLFINYSNTVIDELNNDILTILKARNTDFLNNLKNEIKHYPYSENFIKLLQMIVEIKNPNLNVVKKLFESILDFDLQLNDFSYNWFVKNYFELLKYVFEDNENTLYDFISKHSLEFNINIEFIDVNLINLKDSELNRKLVISSNEYLKQNISIDPNFLKDKNSQMYKILFKLLDNDNLDKEVIKSLYTPLKIIILNNNLVRDELYLENILRLKKCIDFADLEKLINEIVTSSPRKGIIYLIPEVLNKFNLISDIQRSHISNQISIQKESYNNDLIDFLAKGENENLAVIVKNNLNSMPESKVFKYAQAIGFI